MHTPSQPPQESPVISASEYRQLFDSVRQGFCIIEMLFDAAQRPVDYRFLQVNRMFEEQTGLVDPVGKTMRELVPEHENSWFDIYGQVALSGEPVHFEHVSHVLQRYFELDASRIGRPEQRRVAVLFQDITARRQAELALRASESRFRTLAEATPALIWQLDQQGQAVYINPRCIEVLGMDLAQLQAIEWSDLLHEEDATAYMVAIQRAISTQSRLQKRVRLKTVQGWRWIESYALPWFSVSGEYLGHVGTSIDVNDLVEAQDILHLANRRKDEFIATLSHELRNPLTSIKNAAEVLASARFSAERNDWAVEVIRRQADAMGLLLKDLLDLSKSSAGKLNVERRPVDLAEVIEAALELTRPLIDAAQHEFSLQYPPQALTVLADPLRLSQAISNLLTNAVKYTNPGGKLALVVRAHAGMVDIAVSDDGIGLQPDSLQQVFEMFSQVHNVLDRSEGGLGIGLALVRKIVELHQGSVRADSAGLGRGSTFTICLPQAEALAPAHAPVHTPATQAAPAPAAPIAPIAATVPNPAAMPHNSAMSLRILIADDNIDSAEAIGMLLELSGHHISLAHTGKQILASAEAERPDVVVLDIGIPDLNGYEIAKRIRASSWGQRMTLIACTGWGQDEDKRSAAEAGFDAHLTKPFEPSALESLIAATHQPG